MLDLRRRFHGKVEGLRTLHHENRGEFDVQYAWVWLNLWVWSDLTINCLSNMFPVLRAVPHLAYTFMLHGVIPIYLTYRLLGSEVYKPRTFIRLFSMFLVVQSLTDIIWCVAVGRNPLNPFGDWRYPNTTVPTYLFFSAKFFPALIVYREVAVKNNLRFLTDKENKKLFYGTLAFLFTVPLPFMG